jgi:hypothetical protein
MILEEKDEDVEAYEESLARLSRVTEWNNLQQALIEAPKESTTQDSFVEARQKKQEGLRRARASRRETKRGLDQVEECAEFYREAFDSIEAFGRLSLE